MRYVADPPNSMFMGWFQVDMGFVPVEVGDRIEVSHSKITSYHLEAGRTCLGIRDFLVRQGVAGKARLKDARPAHAIARAGLAADSGRCQSFSAPSREAH
jgi:hypothetical protein